MVSTRRSADVLKNRLTRPPTETVEKRKKGKVRQTQCLNQRNMLLTQQIQRRLGHTTHISLCGQLNQGYVNVGYIFVRLLFAENLI